MTFLAASEDNVDVVVAERAIDAIVILLTLPSVEGGEGRKCVKTVVEEFAYSLRDAPSGRGIRLLVEGFA
jgi:hypothetical protein